MAQTEEEMAEHRADLKTCWARYPFLQAAVGWWRVEDSIVELELTVTMLKLERYSRLTDAGGAAWYAYREPRKGQPSVTMNWAKDATHRVEPGMPLAKALRFVSGVKYLIKEERVRGARKITIYAVPQGNHGSRLTRMCSTVVGLMK